MRKLITLLLVIGVLAGTFAVVANVCEEYSFNEHTDFTDDEPTGDGIGDLAPCGGGETGGGGGTPG